jgi:hypothetical protein
MEINVQQIGSNLGGKWASAWVEQAQNLVWAMTDTELNKVCRWVSEGGKLLIGHDKYGKQKIKVFYGPLSVFSSRFDITDEELNRLKTMLLTSMSQAAA